MAQIDWFDVAPAIVFGVVAGLLAGMIGGKSWLAVLAGAAYVVIAGFVAAAAVAFVGLDSVAGLVGSAAITGVFIVPLWLYVIASERTPVSEVEIDETIAEAEAVAKTLPAASGHDPWDAAEMVRGHFDNLLWRLAHDAPRRAEIVAAKRRLEQAMFEDIRDGNPAQP
jgi:hypothetical protein